MVYAHAVNRVTLSGTMFGGAEEWSTGFFMGEEGSDATPFNQLGIDIVRNAWITFFESGNSGISNKYLFTQAKAALIDTNGHTVSEEVYYSYPTTTIDGGSAGPPFPPQCSLVATLQSDRPRGKASKGRMYLPGIAFGIQTNGKLEAQWVGTVADNLKTFFDALEGSFDVPNQLILAAKGTGPLPALTAQNDVVETIKVGDVVDTQRRRRNGLVESYTTRILV